VWGTFDIPQTALVATLDTYDFISNVNPPFETSEQLKDFLTNHLLTFRGMWRSGLSCHIQVSR
jgi:hypothetical protein